MKKDFKWIKLSGLDYNKIINLYSEIFDVTRRKEFLNDLENEIDLYYDKVESIGIGIFDKNGQPDDNIITTDENLDKIEEWIVFEKNVYNLVCDRKIGWMGSQPEILKLFHILNNKKLIDNETFYYRKAIIASSFVNLKNGEIKDFNADVLSSVETRINNKNYLEDIEEEIDNFDDDIKS